MSVVGIYKALKYVAGPKLYRVHDIAAKTGFDYVPNGLESSGDSIINVFRSCAMIFKWSSPLMLIIMYRRSWFTNEGFAYMASLATSGLIVLCIALSIRAIGRFTNEVYSSFIADLVRAESENSVAAKALIRKYDFDFHEWPVNFKCQSEGGRSAGSSLSQGDAASNQNLGFIAETAINILGYCAIHTFGRRLCYPGCLPLIQYLMTPHLTKGRAVLIEEKGGQRNKLHTVDGNDIDTMFVDRRSDKTTANGRTLVICSEGNAGFYEVGTMATPLETGYSVLGWNHPGFWGSTGAPFPSQERNAIDAVMQFAIEVLNFQPENIVLFAWSIGGYTASYAAMSYPDIKYVVLDATFDHLLPLAKARMPPSWGVLVDKTIHSYMNLNIADQLCRYPGPVLLVRRSKDEMITTAGPMVMASNRGNDLLIQFLQCRYPNVMDDATVPFIRDFLAVDEEQQDRQRHSYGVDDQLCESLFKSYVEENMSTFPLAIGQDASQLQKRQLALFLVSQHMKEFDATHCVPLPANFFVTPWDIFSNGQRKVKGT